MEQSYDVIVLGIGAMGSAACYQLARRGVRVLGLEQFDIPHARGSSHGYSRMIRMAYYEHPNYVPLLRRAYELWEELEQTSGEKLLHLTGGLYAGPREGELVRGSIEAARRHGLAHEVLDYDEMRRRFGQFRLPPDWLTVYEQRAGFLLPERCITAFADAALRRGAELHGHEAVTQWHADENEVSVRTTQGEYRAQKLVICGGPWSGSLLAGLGVKLTVTRQVMGWVWPRRPELFELGRFPVWAIENPDGSLQYGFPLSPTNVGLKTAHHGPEAATDPDQVVRDPLPGDEESFKPALSRFLPDADGPVLAMRVCLYTNSPDHHFIIDRHPRHERVVFGCGFSGHGFKFASVIGEVLSDLTLDDRSRHPIEFLGLSRFMAGLHESRA